MRAIFGLKTRTHRNRASGPPAQEVVIGKPQYGLAWFRIRFGMLQVKAYTKGEHVLRLEATVHNAKELRCRRGLDNLGEIISRLAGIAERFATALDCADTGFLPDGILDQLPLPSAVGPARTAGIDLNKPRIRAALAAAVALAPAPHGFTAAQFAGRVCQMTRSDGYTTRQAACDLRKLRGKNLLIKPGRSRRYQVAPRVRPAPSPRSWPSATSHRAHPGRRPQPQAKPQTRPMDHHRPRLREPPHRHAGAFRDLGISTLPAAA